MIIGCMRHLFTAGPINLCFSAYQEYRLMSDYEVTLVNDNSELETTPYSLQKF